jgi:hypothetical protein
MQALLRGDGTRKCPHYIQGFRNEEFTHLSQGFQIAEREGITRLNVAYSGRFFERRSNGWWETSDTEQCDLYYGLPAEGKLTNHI